MALPYDPLREAILLELNRAMCAGLARRIPLDALRREYGLSKETLRLIARDREPGEECPPITIGRLDWPE